LSAKKRRHARVDMEIPAQLSDTANGARKSDVAIGNLGPDGAYVKTQQRLESGKHVRLLFKISSHPLPFDIEAEVRWFREGAEGGVGLQFLNCPAFDRAALDDFCQHRIEETRGAAVSD
jgi:hypothetical protein